MIKQPIKEEFHLFELEVKQEYYKSYLLVKNIFPDPKSIKEDIYEELRDFALEQLNVLVQYYINNVLMKKCSHKEIGKMEVFPIGDELHENKIEESLDIKVLRSENNYCIFGTGKSKIDFLNEYNEDIEEYGDQYSKNVEEYNVYYMPSIEFLNISDIFDHFSWCTKYDYENQKWIE
jgi:hypothetical protein